MSPCPAQTLQQAFQISPWHQTRVGSWRRWFLNHRQVVVKRDHGRRWKIVVEGKSFPFTHDGPDAAREFADAYLSLKVYIVR